MKRIGLPVVFLMGLSSIVDAQSSVPPGAILDAPVSDGQWHWIEVEPFAGSKTGWETFTGAADVRIAGSRFHADLHADPGQQGTAGITLDGEIDHDRVRAMEVMLDTDAKPMVIVGSLRRSRFGNNVVEETIVFRGGQAGDAAYLGLTRSVAR